MALPPGSPGQGDLRRVLRRPADADPGRDHICSAPAIIHLIPGRNLFQSFRTLAPLFPFAAAPALAVGVLLWNRLTPPQLLSRRIAGTAIAIAGTVLLLSAVVVAYPEKPASILCGIYALAAFALAYITGRSVLTWMGAALLLLAPLMWPGLDFERYAGLVGLIHASLCTTGGLLMSFRPGRPQCLGAPLTAALAVSAAALFHSLQLSVASTATLSLSPVELTAHLYWVSAIWLIASIVESEIAVFFVFQVILSAAAASTASCRSRTTRFHRLADFPRHGPGTGVPDASLAAVAGEFSESSPSPPAIRAESGC